MPSRGVQNDDEYLKIREEDKKVQRAKVKKCCELAGLAVLELCCCVCCIILDLAIIIETLERETSTLADIMPIIIASAYFAIIAVDLISWISIRPITYHTWLVVTTSGCLLFYLRTGYFFFHELTTLNVLGILVSFITGSIFFGDLFTLIRTLQRFPVPHWVLKRRTDKQDECCICAGDILVALADKRPICRCLDSRGEPCECDQLKFEDIEELKEKIVCQGLCKAGLGECTCNVCSCAEMEQVLQRSPSISAPEPSHNIISVPTETENVSESTTKKTISQTEPIDRCYSTDEVPQAELEKISDHSYQPQPLSSATPNLISDDIRSPFSGKTLVKSVETQKSSSKSTKSRPRSDLRQSRCSINCSCSTQPEHDYCVMNLDRINEQDFQTYLPGQVASNERATLCPFSYGLDKRNVSITTRIRTKSPNKSPMISLQTGPLHKTPLSASMPSQRKPTIRSGRSVTVSLQTDPSRKSTLSTPLNSQREPSLKSPLNPSTQQGPTRKYSSVNSDSQSSPRIIRNVSISVKPVDAFSERKF